MDEKETVEIPATAGTLSVLVQQFHDLIMKARDLVDRYAHKNRELAEKHAAVLAREKTVDDRDRALIDRESACKQVENVQKLAKDARELWDSANLRLNAAVEAEKSLKIHTEVSMQELNNKMDLNRKEHAATERLKVSIEDEVARRVQAVLKTAGKA